MTPNEEIESRYAAMVADATAQAHAFLDEVKALLAPLQPGSDESQFLRDRDMKISLVNRAYVQGLEDAARMLGKEVADLPWRSMEPDRSPADTPSDSDRESVWDSVFVFYTDGSINTSDGFPEKNAIGWIPYPRYLEELLPKKFEIQK